MIAMRRMVNHHPVYKHLHQIFFMIISDKVNKGNYRRLLYNYFAWFFYHKPRNQRFEISLQNGMKSIVYPDSDSGVNNIFTRNVDYYENVFTRGVINKGDFIIDAGCNVGNRTLVLADIISGALLIDANEKCFSRLVDNFRTNGLAMRRYHLVPKAVGARKGTVAFSDIGGTDCLNRVLADNDVQVYSKVNYVEMTTIDDEMARIGIPDCAFVKLDIEGHDFEALRGAKRTLSEKHVKLVRFERWPTVAVSCFEEFFRDLGWVVFALDSTGRPTLNRKRILSSSDLFAMPRNAALSRM